MKCPACWAEKAYVRRSKGWLDWALRVLLILPMRCHHCYHRFYTFRLLAWGQRIEPPPPRPVQRPNADTQAQQRSESVSH